MLAEHAAFLAVLRARARQRCPGRVDDTFAPAEGHITVGCDRCGAVLRLPLRPLVPAPSERLAGRLHAIVLHLAWKRWRARFAVAGEWNKHVPVPLVEAGLPTYPYEAAAAS